MRRSALVVCGILFLGGSGFFPVLGSTDIHHQVYDVDTTWNDVKFEIVAVCRLDPKNVVMVIQLQVGPRADRPTFIGFMDKGVEVSKVTGQRGEQKKFVRPKYRGFSLNGAFVVDQADKAQYGTVPQVPGKPSYGPSGLITTMSPGDWLQLSVQFNLPVPPPNPDGTVPIQKVDVTLPQAKNTIVGVVVPPLGKT